MASIFEVRERGSNALEHVTETREQAEQYVVNLREGCGVSSYVLPVIVPDTDVPDAECTACGGRFWSGDGHPKLAICRPCWKGSKR